MTPWSTLWQIWRDRDQLYTRPAGRHLPATQELHLPHQGHRPAAPSSPPRWTPTWRALDELLDLASRRGVKVLVYVAPTRWDVQPPYFLDKYDAWKLDLKQDTEGARGLLYSDMDHLVPDKLLGGSDIHDDIDFMHFQGMGHVILAERVPCEEIRKIEAREVSPQGP